jgi:alpha-D-xyloside xylohydrolase
MNWTAFVRRSACPLLFLGSLLTSSCVQQVSTDAEPMVAISSGNYAISFWPDINTLNLIAGEQTLLRFPADAFQLGTVGALDDTQSYDPYWLENGQDVLSTTPPPDLVWQTVQSASLTAHDATSFSVNLDYGGGLSAVLSFQVVAAGRFAATLTPVVAMSTPLAVAWMRLRVRADAEEGFYGMGEWPDAVNHRGQVRPMQIEVANTESSDNEDHVPVPLLLGTRGWGLFVQSRRVGLFDVAHKESDLIEVTYGTAEQSAAGLGFFLFAAEQPIDLLHHYYDLTGYPLLPAPWALGPWLWRHDHSQDDVLSDIQTLRTLDLATSALWIDDGYFSDVGSFDFNSGFSDPASMVQAANAAGLRMALWHVPYIDKSAGAPYAKAVAGRYFPLQNGILLSPWGDPIDFTNPAAYSFWQTQLQNYTGIGIEGFKLDYGEDIAPSFGTLRNIWRFADGSDERTMHYGYTLLYHQVYAELLPKTGGFLLGRAGRWGDQSHIPILWPGDMDATFTSFGESFTPDGQSQPVVGVGGFPATVIQGINLAASGFPFFGADTGGYRHCPANKELYIRWFEQTALSTVMQVGDATDDPPWVFTAANGRDDETLDLYRTYARWHLRLFPYEWTYAQRLLMDGRPIQRAVGLVYPNLGFHPNDEYLFGDDLLVAPVVQSGQVQRLVQLPPGTWYDFWAGTAYQSGDAGTTVIAPAPLGTLPLFIRAGAILPLLRPTIATLAPATLPNIDSYANQAGPLYVRFVPGPAATSFALFDGTVLSQSAAGAAVTLTLTAGSVFLNGPAASGGGAMLELFGNSSAPSMVLSGGVQLAEQDSLADLDAASSGYTYAAPSLWIKLVPGSQQVQVIFANPTAKKTAGSPSNPSQKD